MSSAMLLQPSVRSPDENEIIPTSRVPRYHAYKTPSLGHPFPTDYPDLDTPLVTPTPSFVFIPVTDRVIVAPSPAVPPPIDPSVISRGEESENEVEPPERPVGPASPTPFSHRPTSSPGFPSNSAPYIKKRVRKLSVHSGKWWKFTIPDETFYDVEDGSTRKLELGFFLEGGQPPPADYWIQFNTENQFLYALPTEKNIGKHTFSLMAIDSGGQMVQEKLEVHVRQLTASRSFHHTFTLYQVTWDQVRYPVRTHQLHMFCCVSILSRQFIESN